jgi:predicted HAD superfamily Cof-like phosphohydrolase
MIGPDDLEAFGYWTPDEVVPVNYYPSVQDMVTQYNTEAGSDKSATLYYKLIKEEYKEFIETAFCAPLSKEGDIAELKELADLIYVIYGYAWAKGWDLDEAVRRVHANNMARMYQDDGNIKRREDGKIVKNPNTPKVNLEDLV